MSRIFRSFEAKELKKRPLVVKIADYLTSLFGSISFLLFNILLFSFWIAVNEGKLNIFPPFDPYPYNLLTTIVSLEAIFLSIIVLMSQKRQGYISTLREELDMQINLIEERQSTKILKLLKLLLEKNSVEVKDQELEDMIRDTDVSYIERSLTRQLEGNTLTPREMVKEVVEPFEKAVKKAESSLRKDK